MIHYRCIGEYRSIRVGPLCLDVLRSGFTLFWTDNDRLVVRMRASHPPLFSERNGYQRWRYVGPIKFRVAREKAPV